MKKLLLAAAFVILFISSCSGQKAPKSRPLEERNSQLDEERNPQVNDNQPNGITVKNRTNGDIPFVIHYGSIDVRTADDYEDAVISGSTSSIRQDKDCILATPNGNFRLKKDHNYELFFSAQGKLSIRILNAQ